MQTYPLNQLIAGTAFQPARHGFHFVNTFLWKPALSGIRFGSWKMGFCGGMCAAALHRFQNNLDLPPDTCTPGQETSLFREILRRQLASTPLWLILKVYGLQCVPGKSRRFLKFSLAYLTRKEWPALREKIDTGVPAIIVLIRVNGIFGNLTRNHQVVVTGYRFNPANQMLVLQVYDPNNPGRVNNLTLDLDPAHSGLNAVDSSGDRLRGFFVNPYGDRAAAQNIGRC